MPASCSLLGGILASLFEIFVALSFWNICASGAYAADAGQNIYVYSLGYNSFVFVDIAIVITIGVILFSSKAFMTEVVYKQRAKNAKCRQYGKTYRQANQ